MALFDNIRQNVQKGAEGLKKSASDAARSLTTEETRKTLKNLSDKGSKTVNDLVSKGTGQYDAWKKKRDDKTAAVKSALQEQDKKGVCLSPQGAMKLVYLLMSSDGKISAEESDRFDSIGAEMDSDFDSDREELVNCVEAEIAKASDETERFDTIRDFVGNVIRTEISTETTAIEARLVLWNLVAVAYCDGECSESEKRLMRSTCRELGINTDVLLEMQTAAETMIAIEGEKNYLRSSARPYAEVEKPMKILEAREKTVMCGVHALLGDA